MGNRLRQRPQPALAAALALVREELAVPQGFPADVLAEAEASATSGPVAVPGGRRDLTDVPFVAIDPEGAQDLDQVLHLERSGSGYRFRYGIADVAAWVRPGGALDAETRRRALTLYLPDGKAPLHPEVLSQQAASLLADGHPRPVVVWTFELDADGVVVSTAIERAMVRNRAALHYEGAQRAIDAGTAEEPLMLVREVGRLRQRLEIERGGVSLDLPTQTIVGGNGGHATLAYEAALPIEGWNAQLSLLTGMTAAALMAEAGVGIVRTLPPPEVRLIDGLRATARALGIEWPEGTAYADVVHHMDGKVPRHAAFLTQAARTLRGAGYEAVTPEAPPMTHAAVASPYAHVTAPLRRLVDRYATEAVLAAVNGHEVPEWAAAERDAVIAAMASGGRKERAVERACVDAVECIVLEGREGDRFDATVVDQRKDGLVVQVAEPAVHGSADGDAPLGASITVRLTKVDPAQRLIRFAVTD